MARALGLPAVLGVGGLLADDRERRSRSPSTAIAARSSSTPRPRRCALFAAALEQLKAERKQLRRLAKRPALTRDGIEISLRANVELPFEMDSVAEAGAEGVGLSADGVPVSRTSRPYPARMSRPRR